MKGHFNPTLVWLQVPVADRTVEVNTKTGFSLTAGSYSVRASSNQAGSITIANASGSNTATISAVTVARTLLVDTSVTGTATAVESMLARLDVTNTTTITANRVGTVNTSVPGFNVQELF